MKPNALVTPRTKNGALHFLICIYDFFPLCSLLFQVTIYPVAKGAKLNILKTLFITLKKGGWPSYLCSKSVLGSFPCCKVNKSASHPGQIQTLQKHQENESRVPEPQTSSPAMLFLACQKVKLAAFTLACLSLAPLLFFSPPSTIFSRNPSPGEGGGEFLS